MAGSFVKSLHTGSLRTEPCVRQEVSSEQNYPTGLPIKDYGTLSGPAQDPNPR